MISTVKREREIAIEKELRSKIEWGQDLWQSQSPLLRRKFKGGAFMKQELAYSFHLGSDKNKSKLAKKVAKENIQIQYLKEQNRCSYKLHRLLVSYF